MNFSSTDRRRKGVGPGPTWAGLESHIPGCAAWRGICAVQSVNERRHSGRVPVQIPIILRGKDGAGRIFFDRAQIVLIDDTGARVHTRFYLQPGVDVTVEIPGDETRKLFRDVWSGERDSFYDGMVGLEFVDPRDGWQVDSLKVIWAARKR